MQFTTRKRRQTPTIIIVSLIDVLIVVLIFLMVTTTFKQQPAVKLALPESKQSQAGTSENSMVITIPKQGALHLGTEPLTMEKLQEKLIAAAKQNPKLSISLRADTDAPFGQIIKVMDAVKAANIKSVSASTKGSGQP
ncbi:MAG: exbD2 [Verrucomicrobiales bacterium]|nr:exbD2 [Verrucomicrobiales bacterium]